MTEDELKAIEARANAATPGPWMIHGNMLLAPNEDLASFEYATPGDKALINHCREDIPALLAEVRRLQSTPRYDAAKVEALLEAVARMPTPFGDAQLSSTKAAAAAVRASREPGK